MARASVFNKGDRVDYVDPKTNETTPLGVITRIGSESSFFLTNNCYKVEIIHPRENERPVGQESFFWYSDDRLRLSANNAFSIGDTVRIEMYNRPPKTGVIRSEPILENPNARAKGVWYDVECHDYVDDKGNDSGLIHASRLTKATNLKGD